jgi:hypothetical protein
MRVADSEPGRLSRLGRRGSAVSFVGSAASALSTITFDVAGSGSAAVMNGLGTFSPPVSGFRRGSRCIAGSSLRVLVIDRIRVPRSHGAHRGGIDADDGVDDRRIDEASRADRLTRIEA